MQKVRLRPKLQPAAVAPESVTADAPLPNPGPVAATPRPAPVPPAPVPPLLVAEPTPAPAVSPAPIPVPPAPPATPPAAVVGDPGKFKLKPKTPTAPPAAPAAGTPPVPPLFLPNELPAAAPGQLPVASLSTAPGSTLSAPPPVSDPAGRAGKSTPPMPVPHVKVEAADLVPEVDLVIPARRSSRGGGKKFLVALVVLAAAGYGIYTGWPHIPAEFSFAGYTVRTKPGLTIAKSKSAPAASVPTPSEALNKLAHMPVNAINKAQDALNARRASGQDRVDAAANGEDLPSKSFGVPPAAPIKAAVPATKPRTTTTSVTTVAPGLSATTPVEAAPDASAEFRAYIVNARVSGVFQGNPARAVINGRLMRVGEVVDAGLGITFEGIDPNRRSLVFKDRGGAIVTRRF